MAPRFLDLGLPRTGTQSLANALPALSYEKVYHMRTVNDTEGHRAKWVELIDAKFGPEKREIQPEELKALLQDYDACADFPASLFPHELVTAFPHAKIIVTTRDEDSWIRSMETTLVASRNSRKGKPAEPRHAMADKYHLYCWGDDFEANGRKYWREREAMMKETLPKDRVLWFDVKTGWEPLCKFLGVPVPDEPFPNADDWKKYKVQKGYQD